jgi:hypothetical protein
VQVVIIDLQLWLLYLIHLTSTREIRHMVFGGKKIYSYNVYMSTHFNTNATDEFLKYHELRKEQTNPRQELQFIKSLKLKQMETEVFGHIKHHKGFEERIISKINRNGFRTSQRNCT